MVDIHVVGSELCEGGLQPPAPIAAVVVGGDAIDIAALKSINPDVMVFGYWGALFRYESDTLGLSEDMYFHDPATLQRVQKNAPGTIFDGMWLMDPGSAAWRQYSIEGIGNILKAGFDGIHLDEVIGDLTNPIWSFRGYTRSEEHTSELQSH